IWKTSRQYKTSNRENGTLITKDKEHCYSYCTTLSYNGGVIPTNEESVCYCYELFSPVDGFKGLLAAYAQKSEGLNLHEYAEKVST
ncbi:hypothetical protein V5799_009920, partial [Amblyomma americanum]